MLDIMTLGNVSENEEGNSAVFTNALLLLKKKKKDAPLEPMPSA